MLTMGAFFLGNLADTPEFYMEPEQAKGIREALEELCRLYPIGLSEKKIAWVNFSFEVGGWLTPGIIAVWKKKPVLKARQEPVRMERTNGIPMPPVTMPEVTVETAKVPSQLWPQSGDIETEE